MSDEALNQARQLLGTIMQFQRRVLIRTARRSHEQQPPAKELSMPQMTTLLVIRERGEMSVKEIAHATHVSPPSASAMTDRLVELGMVTRKNSRVDRREVCVAMTDEGKEKVETLERELLNSVVEILKRIGPDYAQQWCEVYGRIQQCLDEDANLSENARQNIVDEVG